MAKDKIIITPQLVELIQKINDELKEKMAKFIARQLELKSKSQAGK